MAGPSPLEMDAYNTRLVLQAGEELMQSIAAGSLTPNGSNNTINIPMRAVGLTRGFLVKITATLANAGASTATLTPWGAANILSNITLTDLDNYQRVNTSGAHIHFLNSAKEEFPFGAALLATSMDAPVKYGNVTSALSASATIAAAGTGTIQMYYWVPCAYGQSDLRGAIYTGVTNATGYLAMTVNASPGVVSGDAVQACYSGVGTAVSITNVTFNVYQKYVDQLPRYQDGPMAGRPVLPMVSLSTQYRMFNTSLSAISANQDFPIPFTNFQSFLSTLAIYDQAGTLSPGTDIDSWSLAAANTLQFFKRDPITQALMQRIRLKTDFPAGVYWFDFRDAPINTNQAGNMQLVMRPLTAAPGSQVLVGWESFANVNTVLGAGSLAAS